MCANKVFTLAIAPLIKLKQKVLRLLIVNAEEGGGEKRVTECNEYRCVMNDWAPPAVIQMNVNIQLFPLHLVSI